MADAADRIPPLAPEDWPDAMREALAALSPPEPRHPLPSRDPSRPKGLNILGVLAQHPALTRAYHTFNGHVLFGTTLSVRQRELLVLRVAALRNAPYEWAQHVAMAEEAEITPAEIERMGEGSTAEGWSSFDRALLAAAEELVADARIGDATWAVLADELDEQQLLDVVFTVGAYDIVAMLVRTAGVELDDDLRKWASH